MAQNGKVLAACGGTIPGRGHREAADNPRGRTLKQSYRTASDPLRHLLNSEISHLGGCMTLKIAFLGTGIMGAPMAINVVRGGAM